MTAGLQKLNKTVEAEPRLRGCGTQPTPYYSGEIFLQIIILMRHDDGERVMGLEPTISCLGSMRSTTELHPLDGRIIYQELRLSNILVKSTKAFPASFFGLIFSKVSSA